MFVLLQVYPPEASDRDDRCCCLDVIAVDASKAELERYLVAYEYRYNRAACEDFDAWDDVAKNWGDEHDRMHGELLDKYQVYGSLIAGAEFEIVACLSGGKPVPEREPMSPNRTEIVVFSPR